MLTSIDPSMLSSSSIACLSASLGDCSVLQIFSKIADQKMIEIYANQKQNDWVAELLPVK